MRFVRENGLSLVFGALFLATLAGQSVAGYRDYNSELMAHDEHLISYGRYLVSSEFGAAVMENWQSEYLQFFLYVLLTVWLIQKGSAESKKPGEAGLESDEQQEIGPHASTRAPKWARAGGWRTHVFSNSLLLVMGAIFLATWFAQSVTAWTQYNSEQLTHMDTAVSWLTYVGTADFWEKSLQNWQSELLAVGSFAVFTIYLRQRGSPESKPVGAPHDRTGI